MGLMITPGGRLFDPSTGRFLSRDPVRRPGQNPYAALANNPLRVVDPAGRANVFEGIEAWQEAQKGVLERNANAGPKAAGRG